MVVPLIEYADDIWDNQKQNLINKLENIQLDAARIVTGGGGGGGGGGGTGQHHMTACMKKQNGRN